MLKDSSLPPGAIVEENPDGSALRNDGVKLTPANQNPWYLLATVAGEWGDIPPSGKALHLANRRFWNCFMCKDLNYDEREALRSKLNLDAQDVAPLTEEETWEIAEKFKKAGLLKNYVQICYSLNKPNFSNVYFTKSTTFNHFYFRDGAEVRNSYFKDLADFNHTQFAGFTFFC
jgi:hypothetical protein